MDIQSRTAEYGLGRHHAHAEIEARCLTPLLTYAKNGGITVVGQFFDNEVCHALVHLQGERYIGPKSLTLI